MTNRFFAFGCSYTNYSYPTWADYIGVTFDQYYNYARAGCSNTFIMNRVVEADEKYKFNSETDLIIIMITGFGRFSHMNAKEHPKRDWVTHGDLMSYTAVNKHDKMTKFFLDNIWTENWAVYQSWIAIKVIKQLLTLKNIKHKILMGIDNTGYKNGVALLDQDAKVKVNEIYELLDVQKSLDEWKQESLENKDSPYWNNLKHVDGHPSHKAHYKFAQDYFPELINEKSLDLLNFWKEKFTYESQEKQGTLFNKLFREQFDCASKNTGLF